jgi:heat shock protein HslJ
MRAAFAILVALHFACAASTVLAADPPIGLAGSEWGFAGENGPNERFVQFGSDGRVSGSGGCNRFTGQYQQQGERLEVSGLSSTLMACSDEVMQRESGLTDALQAVRTIEATHLVLRLLGEDGGLIAELQRRDFD